MSDEQLGFGMDVEVVKPEKEGPTLAQRKEESARIMATIEELRGTDVEYVPSGLEDDEPLALQRGLWVDQIPEYVRPTIAEALAVEPSGLQAVGSFSGCGGSSLGLRMGGIDVRYVVEFVPAARETYTANQPDTHIDPRDIRQIKATEILKHIGLDEGELDVFEGSPPCASFTPAGKREKLWGTQKSYSDTKQRTDDLFWEWARVLDGLRPRAFVAENVPGLLMGNALSQYAQKITVVLSDLGYHVQARVLNAANYGVPQTRRRLIFVGIRRDLGVHWEWPAPTSPVPHTTRQALEAVPADDPDHEPFLADVSMLGTSNELRYRHLQEQRWRHREGGVAGMYGKWVEADNVRCQRCGKYIVEHTIERRTGAGWGGRTVAKSAACADGSKAVFPKNGFQFIVPDPDRPCATVIADGWGASGGSLVHPSECRKLTPAEVKSISSFPSDFVLTGKLMQRYERIGRAVPPMLYKAIGEQLVKTLKRA